MMEFKIMAAPDRSQLGAYRHLGPELRFGRSEGDMLLDDPQVAPLSIRVRAQGGAFVLENLGGEEVKLNGKAVPSQAPIRERDVVIVGRTTINFTRLDQSAPPPPERFEHPNRATRFAEGTRDKAILDALETLAEQAGTGAPPQGPGPAPAATNPPRPPGRS